MKTKLKFVTPRVTQTVELCPEVDLLQTGSVAEKTYVLSMGQAVEDYDFSEGNADGYSIDYFE